MQRIDGSYLYRLGHQIHGLTEWPSLQRNPPPTYNDIFFQAYFAADPLQMFLDQSVFNVKYCRQAGIKLFNNLTDLKNKMIAADFDLAQLLDFDDHYQITSSAKEFETVFTTEFNQMPLYIVAKKGAYDTADLIENGATLFPVALAIKVPDAVFDVSQAARCLAFELPTASGFHIHRANESVLKKYFSVVAPNESAPATRNMGDYLNILEQKKLGNAHVRSALKDLKNLHRNPLIHPEVSLEDTDEAMSLISAVHAVVGYMLREIPNPSLES